jgi:hypothetical protein
LKIKKALEDSLLIMGIKIGNNNIINNSKIKSEKCSPNRPGFMKEHPLLSAVLASLISGIILYYLLR